MARTGLDNDSDTRLGFTFRLVGGAGKLAMSDVDFFGWLHVERLELEVPDLPLPLDLAAGPERFQRRRTNVVVASLRIDQKALERYVADRGPHLANLGVDQLRMRCCDGYLSVSARVRDGAHVADATFRTYITGTGLGIRVLASHARVYGNLPTPAPVIAHRIAAALVNASSNGHSDPHAPSVRGLGQIELEPLKAFLWSTLPAAGWRLPSTSNLELAAAIVMRGSLQLSYAAGSGDGNAPTIASPAAAEVASSLDQLRSADQALLEGDIDRAMRAYRGELAARGPDQPLLLERLLSVASARAEYYVDAIEMARQVLGRWPDFPAAHAALAAIDLARGDTREAATRYQTLASATMDTGDDEASAYAALAGARLLRALEPLGSTYLYELVLEFLPGHAEASEALVERFTAEERWHELVRLIRGRLLATTDRSMCARDHLRLAEILGQRLGDLSGARDELQTAAALDPDQTAVYEAQAEIYLQLDDQAAAIAALDEVLRIHTDRDDVRGQSRAHNRAAEIWETSGDSAEAELRFRSALDLDADDRVALRGAARAASRRAEHRAAIDLWRRLISLGDHPPDREAYYRCQLGASLLEIGDLEAAREAAEHALRAGTKEVEAEAHALLATAFRRQSDDRSAADELDAAVIALAGAASDVFERARSEETDADEAPRLLTRAAQLALERARLLDGLGDEKAAQSDYERAHSLAADYAPDAARDAARCLVQSSSQREDPTEQRRWIDAVLATRPADSERVDLLLRRAKLRMDELPPATDAAVRDIDEALSCDPSDSVVVEALALQAEIFAATGEMSDRAAAVSARAELITDPIRRTEADADAAAAWLDADDYERALECAQRVATRIELSGESVPNLVRFRAFRVMGEAAWRGRSWPDVIHAYEQLPDEEITSEEVAELQHRAGVALAETGDPDRAAALLEMVVANPLAASATRTNTWRLLTRIYEEQGDAKRAATALEECADDQRSEMSSEARAQAWYRAGDIHRKLDHTADAERCLEAALRLVGDHLPALDVLERIKREQGDNERVAVILGRKIAATSKHPGRQKALLGRLAYLQDHDLNRPDVARETYRRALEIDRDFRPALRFMATDACRAGDLGRAVDCYERLTSELSGDFDLPDTPAALAAERIEAAITLANLAFGDRSTFGQRAITAVERVLAHAPDNERLAALLASLRREDGGNGDAGNGAHSSEVVGRTVTDRVYALRKLADEARDGLDLESAAEYLDEACQLAPTDPNVLRDRADLAVAQGDFPDCARWLHALASLPGDDDESRSSELRRRKRQAETYLELADIYYDHLDDVEAARAAMRSAADAYGAGSRRDAALRILAAEAIAHRADDDAIAAYESVSADRRTPADRLNLAKCHQRIGRDHRAIAVLEQAERDDALSDEAAMMLFALHKERDRKAELAATLERRATGVPASEAVLRLHEALELYRDALGDEIAAARVQAALEDLEANPPALAEPLPVSEDEILAEAVAEPVAPEPEPEPVAPEPEPVAPEPVAPDPAMIEAEAGVAAASGDTRGAAQLFAQALTERARARAAVSASLDDAAYATLDELRRISRKGLHFSSLADGLMTASAVELDRAKSCALLREAAAIRRAHLDDFAGAADALGRALALQPADSSIMSDLDTTLRDAGDLGQLVAAYQLHLQALQGVASALPLYQLGSLYRDSFGESLRSGAYFEQAHEADPTLSDVWIPLANYRVTIGDLTGARDLFELALERGDLDRELREFIAERVEALSRDPDVVSGELGGAPEPDLDTSDFDYELRIAAELEERKQPEAAISHYEAAAAGRPRDPRALQALERLYKTSGDYDALTEILGRLINATEDRGARAQLWYRRAQLYRDVLHREPETYNCMKNAYANDPDNTTIAYALRSIAMAHGEWALAAELIYREIASAEGPRDAGALHTELAMMFDEKLLDPEQARVNYEQALALDPDIPAAPAPLARLYEIEQRFADASRMCELAADVARTDDDRSRLLRRAAINAERAQLSEEARRLYNLAAVTASNDADSDAAQSALARLASDSSATNDELLELRLREAADDTERVDLLRQLLDRASRANDAAGVKRYATSLLEVMPADLSAYIALKSRAEADGDHDALVAVLDARAGAMSDPSERASAYFELGRAYRAMLDDLNAAVGAFEQALAAEPLHPGALESLAEIAYKKHDWPRARELFGRLRPETCSMQADMIALRRGEIAEALGHEEEALEAFSEAVKLNTSNREALSAMSRAALRLSDHRVAIEASRTLLEMLPPHDVVAISTARLQLAELCQRAGDAVAAIYYYELVLSEDPRSQLALRALTTLYVQRRNYAGAARALRSLITQAQTPQQRADLQYRLGELYRVHVGDEDLASDAFLKGIDLDPRHVPTLRRLIDYYWRIDDADALMEIIADLAATGALLDEATGRSALARAMLTATFTGADELATAIAEWLGPDANEELAGALVAAADRGGSISPDRLIAATIRMCSHIDALTVPGIIEQLSTQTADGPARALIDALGATVDTSA